MNRAFRFGLERLRAVRERGKKLAKQQLASAISELAREDEPRAAEIELERARVQQRGAMDGSRALSVE